MSRSLLEASARDDRVLLEKALSHELGEFDHDDVNQALLRAALNGNKECVERLVAEGAEIDCDDSDGDTPLMLAAANDHLNVVQLLLQYGCDVDLQSDRDRCALHMAIWNRCMRIVDLLLDIGCDVNLQERYGDTPLLLAARRGYPEAVEAVLRRGDCDINVRSYEKETALHYAAKYGHPQCLKLILDHKPDLEPTTLWGHTPLLLAAMGEHIKCTKILLDAGANSNVSDKSNKYIIHYLAKNNMLESLKLVLTNRTNPNIADDDGVTPLMEAIRSGHQDTVKLLIQYGANVSVIGKATLKSKYSLCTPLEMALHCNNISIAIMLAAAGSTAKDLQVFCDTFPNLSFNEDVYRWVADFLSDPVSLQAMCRCAIRDSLANRLMAGSQYLPLPTALKAYVTFTDL